MTKSITDIAVIAKLSPLALDSNFNTIYYKDPETIMICIDNSLSMND